METAASGETSELICRSIMTNELKEVFIWKLPVAAEL